MRLLLFIITVTIITIYGTTGTIPDDRLYEEQSGNAG
jgi:hypothetical protein